MRTFKKQQELTYVILEKHYNVKFINIYLTTFCGTWYCPIATSRMNELFA